MRQRVSVYGDGVVASVLIAIDQFAVVFHAVLPRVSSGRRVIEPSLLMISTV
jgi:hypothetical protein